MTKPTLTLIRGVQGSGKSTLADELHFELCLDLKFPALVEVDQYFTMPDGSYKFDMTQLGYARQWAVYETMKLLHQGHDVIVAEVLDSVPSVFAYYRPDLWDTLTIIHCQDRFKNIHNVPEETVEDILAGFSTNEAVASIFKDEHKHRVTLKVQKDGV